MPWTEIRQPIQELHLHSRAHLFCAEVSDDTGVLITLPQQVNFSVSNGEAVWQNSLYCHCPAIKTASDDVQLNDEIQGLQSITSWMSHLAKKNSSNPRFSIVDLQGKHVISLPTWRQRCHHSLFQATSVDQKLSFPHWWCHQQVLLPQLWQCLMTLSQLSSGTPVAVRTFLDWVVHILLPADESIRIWDSSCKM